MSQDVMMIIAESLEKMGHHQKAEAITDMVIKVEALKKENLRLLNIFQKLDRMYQPHTPGKPSFGMLDSPQSLIFHTREAINHTLNKGN